MKENAHERRISVVALAVAAVCTATTWSAQAQRAGVPLDVRAAIVATDTTAGLQAALNDLPASGLRVVLGGYDGVFFSAAPTSTQPGTYRAIRENSPERLEQSLNAAGKQSFRLIPATLTRSDTANVAVAHMADGSPAYQYRVVRADKLDEQLGELAPRGYSIAGVFTQQSGMAATVMGKPGRLFVVLEAPLGASPSTAALSPGHRVVSALRASTIDRELNEATAEGYRVLGGSFMNVLLERTGNAPPRSYRVIGAIRGRTLVREVEEAAREGYRVLPTAIMGNPNSKAETVIVMERTLSASERYDYRWVSGTRLATPGVHDDYIVAGFEPVALWRFSLDIPDEFGNRPRPAAASYSVLFEKRR